MRLVLAVLALLVVAPAAHGASAPLLVVDRNERVLAAPSAVTLKARTVRVGGRRCRVGARTPLSVLAGTRLRLGLRDYGACSRRPRDAGGLYVRSIAGTSARGRQGWVYKVGRRLGSAGASDPAGPFGTGRLRAGARVTWFWCRPDRQGRCQRTLELRHAALDGGRVRVTVRAHDDHGRGALVEGATVRLGDRTALTGPDGTATLTGSGRLTATKAGLVAAFPVRVR
jgi:hypothetical protein